MASYRPAGSSITPVVKNLLIANVLVFIAQNYFESVGYPLEDYGALWAIHTGNFRVWQLITYQFMHFDFRHIAYNMLGLYFFGVELERLWGSKRFLEFYLICGIAAGLVQLAVQPAGSTIGASGAVMGILAAFAYLLPNTSIMLFPIPIPIAAKYLVSGMILMDLFGAVSPSDDKVAHFAHLGGALAGIIIVIIWNRRNRRNFY